MVDPVEQFKILSYHYILHIFICSCNSGPEATRSEFGCVNFWSNIAPRPRRFDRKITKNKHNKTKILKGNQSPKNFVKQTKRWRATKVVLNGSIFSEFDSNKVGNIVLKYIP